MCPVQGTGAHVRCFNHGAYDNRKRQRRRSRSNSAIGTANSERSVHRLKNDVRDVATAFTGLEKDVGPGSKTAATPPGAVRSASVHPDDPNKGQFGELAEANGRRLTATIKPEGGSKSARCRVIIQVLSTDPARPLTGKVKLHLHPTFGQWSAYDVDVKGGVAQDTIVSYGAFTIGAEADSGNTRLELDLTDVPGGTEAFYEQ
jgi:hypothetical protein